MQNNNQEVTAPPAPTKTQLYRSRIAQEDLNNPQQDNNVARKLKFGNQSMAANEGDLSRAPRPR